MQQALPVGRRARSSSAPSYAALFWALLVRDVKGRYRRSTLGIWWAVIQPLLLLCMFLLLRGIIGLPSEGVPFPLFALSALIPWQFLVNSVSRGGPSVISNAGIIKKIGLPLEVFPLSAVALSLIDLAVSLVLLAAMMAYYHVAIGWNALWFLGMVGITGLVGFGISLIVAAVGTFRQDVLFAVPFLFQIGMLASPIMYGSSSVPGRWRHFFQLNPMVGVLDGSRRALLHDAPPDFQALGVAVAVALVTLAIGWPLFRNASRYFADIL